MARRPVRKQRTYTDLSKPHGDVLLEVHLPEDRMRLDVFLAERFSWRSRTKLQAMIERREILVNGEPAAKASQRVLHRDRILVRVPHAEGPLRNEEIPIRLLHEDPHLLALDKPAGVICHPVGRIRYGTLVNALHARYRNPDDPALDVVPRLCHRLDRETSGVILVALAPGVRRRMQWIFESKKVVKEYLAVVEGPYPLDHEIVDLPIGRAKDSHLRIARGIDRDAGDRALTVVNVEERFQPREGDGGFTLVRASPITGRQHQIRVHLAARGHPVLGDTMYGPLRGCESFGPGDHREGIVPDGKEEEVLQLGKVAGPPTTQPGGARPSEGPRESDSQPRRLRFKGFPPPPATPVIARHALHAHRIQFPHPVSGEELDLRAPLPGDMARLIQYLRER